MTLVNLKRVLDEGVFEGVPFRTTGTGYEIEPGDTYLAERNVGVKLLTCKENNRKDGWIVPVEPAYPYDTHECVRIELDI